MANCGCIYAEKTGMAKERMKANQISPLNLPKQTSLCVSLSVCDVTSLIVYVMRVDLPACVKIGPVHLTVTTVKILSLYRIKAQFQTNGSVFPYEPQVGATILP